MTVKFQYVATPPQTIRSNYQLTQAFPGDYVVGDRLSTNNSTHDGVDTYRCTVGGTTTSGNNFNPNSVSPYSFGPTTWVKITADSWANAATIYDPFVINYVDYNIDIFTPYESASYNANLVPGCVVFVDPATMLPATGAKLLQRPVDNMAMFFGNTGAGGYHSRARFGYSVDVNSLNYPEQSGNKARPTVDTEVVFDNKGAAAAVPIFTGSMRGGKFTIRNAPTVNFSGSNQTDYVPNSPCIAVTVDAPETTSVTNLGNDFAAALVPFELKPFGFHINHNAGGSVFTGPSSYDIVQQGMWRTPVQFSENNTPPLIIQQGMTGAFKETQATYRNGAAPAPDPNRSVLWGGQTNLDFGAMRVSPWIFVHNKLTGARTLTLHFLTDSPWTNLTDLDIWLECFYPSSATTPLYSLATTENPNWGAPAASPTALTQSGAAWTAPTIFYPTAWKLTLSLSPQRIGMLLVRLQCPSSKLGKYVVFVCPYVDVA